MKLVIDIENTVDYPYPDSPKEIDGSPFNPQNTLVSVGIQNVETMGQDYYFTDHSKLEWEDKIMSRQLVQAKLDTATLLVGHNIKHDIVWLRQSGFTIPDVPLYDTMFFEYVSARGRKLGFGLADCADRHNLSKEGKLDILKNYMDQGVPINEIPIDELEKYGRQDIQLTTDLYNLQQKRIAEDESGKLKTMQTAVDLMNDFLPVVIEMYEAGSHIDNESLNEMYTTLNADRNQLKRELEQDMRDLMGDKPYNLNSPDDLCKVLYSRQVRDKRRWANIFNIGEEQRGHVKKKKQLNIMPVSTFNRIVNDMLTVYKTKAHKCPTCKGAGFILKFKKNGEPYKKHPNCSECKGLGIVYKSTGEVAGLKLKPRNKYATASGFAGGKDIIEEYTTDHTVPEKAKNFIVKLNKYNKLCTWVDTFISNIQKYQHEGILHTNFNQCVTATGRLSSTRPNMQNQPKRDENFVIRKVFDSRWEGGKLIDADFGQLEFRIAALLSQCPMAIKAVEDGLDIHTMTMEFYHGKLEYQPEVLLPDMTRQEAKADTFGPLYGKQTAWTKQFYTLFPGIAEWHERLMEEAVTTKEIKTPSGRIYAFPDCRRFQKRDGTMLVSGHTQIKNYPVQGFATGDMVMLVMIDIYRYLREHNAKSKVILQVHDSATTDTHPEETDLVIKAYQYAFGNVYAHAKERFGIDVNVPLAFDLTIGDNWLEQKKIKVLDI